MSLIRYFLRNFFDWLLYVHGIILYTSFLTRQNLLCIATTVTNEYVADFLPMLMRSFIWLCFSSFFVFLLVGQREKNLPHFVYFCTNVSFPCSHSLTTLLLPGTISLEFSCLVIDGFLLLYHTPFLMGWLKGQVAEEDEDRGRICLWCSSQSLLCICDLQADYLWTWIYCSLKKNKST